ncbi:copper chaperone PCu(A)C [Sphaerisporangium sp. TRM90804]|uniref:copper chaperone PCu(A)C n=1 Tax=Sphaerisporangium sp. TRM90804 TaxID=3031113 RepID=UPI00244BC178|nr:copper chaperone PCu(A)C [Sphaerisporangium sp. TRM90804]MDH2425281.1 copper chaperone PCu(A)C [Sphaerisporangium sp. TRM90804]
MFSRVIVVLVGLAALTACASGETTSSPAAAPTVAASAPASPSAPAPALVITDPWVKTAEKGMSAAFGTLVNNTDADLTIVSGATPVSAVVELHEVVQADGKMVMQPKKGGFVIPARGSHVLEPGGDHIMLMKVTEAVKAGAEVPFTLTLKDGATFEFTALGKDFAGGNEDYQPEMDMGGENG